MGSDPCGPVVKAATPQREAAVPIRPSEKSDLTTGTGVAALPDAIQRSAVSARTGRSHVRAL